MHQPPCLLCHNGLYLFKSEAQINPRGFHRFLPVFGHNHQGKSAVDKSKHITLFDVFVWKEKPQELQCWWQMPVYRRCFSGTQKQAFSAWLSHPEWGLKVLANWTYWCLKLDKGSLAAVEGVWKHYGNSHFKACAHRHHSLVAADSFRSRAQSMCRVERTRRAMQSIESEDPWLLENWY